MPAVSDRARLKSCEAWIKSNGGSIYNVSIANGDCEERGVVATAHVLKEQPVARIPKNCIITSKMGANCTLGQQISAHRSALPAFERQIFLLCFLLDDMTRKNSRFKPYYDILPQNLRNMPVFWADSELDAFCGSDFRNCVRRRQRVYRDHYMCLFKAVPAMRCHSFEAYSWARMIVSSRNFGVVMDGKPTSCLIPFADMFNHHLPKETAWRYDDSCQAFTMWALQLAAA